MTTDIHCFVFDGLSDWETGYALAGINTPRLPARTRRLPHPHPGG